jgi:hypothetical protein
VDFVHPDEVAAGLASSYDVLYLAYPLMLPRVVAEALKAYVRAGGTLISEARPAWNDDRGYANARIPGAGLDEVFGAREKLLRPAETIVMKGEPDLDGALEALAGRSFTGTAFAEHLETTDSSVRVLARFADDAEVPGEPAIVLARYGAGRAILIGSFPGAAFEQDPEKMRSAGELLQALTAVAGVAPDVRIDGAAGLVEARLLESSDAIVVIALNHSDAPQTVTMTFPRFPRGRLAEHGERRRREFRCRSWRSDVHADVRRSRCAGADDQEAVAVSGDPRFSAASPQRTNAAAICVDRLVHAVRHESGGDRGEDPTPLGHARELQNGLARGVRLRGIVL